MKNKLWFEFLVAVRNLVEIAGRHPDAYLAWHGCAVSVEVEDDCVSMTAAWDGDVFVDQMFSKETPDARLKLVLEHLKPMIPVEALPSASQVYGSLADLLQDACGCNLEADNPEEDNLAIIAANAITAGWPEPLPVDAAGEEEEEVEDASDE